LAQKLAAAAAAQPGRLGGVIAAHCPPAVQQALAGYCAAGGVSIV
jgi:hypothetical protein